MSDTLKNPNKFGASSKLFNWLYSSKANLVNSQKNQNGGNWKHSGKKFRRKSAILVVKKDKNQALMSVKFE